MAMCSSPLHSCAGSFVSHGDPRYLLVAVSR
jgi:hypothetical protein